MTRSFFRLALAALLALSSLGAAAESRHDATQQLRQLLQAAAPGSTVRIPAGEHWISLDEAGVGLEIPSGVTVDATGATIRLIETDRTGYFMLAMSGTDSHLVGGTIIGDRERHRGTAGEWGMCVGIRGATRASIRGTKVMDCWGDGIYVGLGNESKQPSRDITIEGVEAVNNRRNNISLIAVDGFRVSSVRLYRANGHLPEAGIDLEPNRGDVIANGILSDIDTADNAGSGVVFGGRKGKIVNVRMERIRSYRNGNNGYWIQSGQNVQAKDLVASDNFAHGIAVVLMQDFTLTGYSATSNAKKKGTTDVRVQDSSAIVMERATADGQALSLESRAVHLRRSNTVTIR